MQHAPANVTQERVGRAILTASVIFLLAVASVFQYLMGVTGVPNLLADVLYAALDPRIRMA